MNTHEFFIDLHQRYLEQQYKKMQQALAQAQKQEEVLQLQHQLDALRDLIYPPTVQDASPSLQAIYADADYVVVFNALRQGYTQQAVLNALEAEIRNREYPTDPQYASNIMQNARNALNQDISKQNEGELLNA